MSEHVAQSAEIAPCPTCGPTATEAHPRRPGVTRCANCKEWLAAEKAADTLRDVIFRMAEDITRIKVVCTQEHPPKMGSPTPDWPTGTQTRHSDASRCVLLNDGDWACVYSPGQADH